MLEVKPNKEILKIKNIVFLGLSLWEIGWICSGIIVASLVYFVIPLPAFIKGELIFPIVAFFSVVGFHKIDGMNLFEFVFATISTRRMRKKTLILESREEDVNED